MSEDDVRNIFCSYGSSTKNTSNKYVGLLGIGAKSPFAYTNSFQIISFFNGEKLIFNAYIDETEMGKLALLHKEPSNEETGIEISIPVKNGDIPTFICKCQYLFRFLDIHPNVVGNTSYVHEINEYAMKGDGWGFIEQNKTNNVGYNIEFPIIIMGGCPYSVDSNKMELSNQIHRNILNQKLILFAPIGSIEIAASREEVKYTTKTVNFIKSRLEIVEIEAKRIIDEKFNSANSLYEAYKLYGEYKDNRSIYYAILNNNYSPKYKDKPITQEYFYIPNDDKYIEGISKTTCEKTYSYSSKERFYISNDNSLNFNDPTLFFVCNSYKSDFQELKVIKKRIRFYARDRLKANINFRSVGIEYIKFRSLELKDEWISNNGIPPERIICIDTIEIPKIVRAKKSAQPITIEQYVYKYNYTNKRFDNVKIDIDKINGYYLQTWYNQFILNKNTKKMDCKNNTIEPIVDLLKKIDPLFASDIYLVSKSQLKKNKLLLPFDEFAITKIKDYVKNNPITKIKSDQIYCKHLLNLKKIYKKLNIDKKYIDTFDIIEIDNGANNHYRRIINVCAILGIEYNSTAPNNEEVTKTLEEFNKEFPFLDHMSEYRWNDKNVIEYINAIVDYRKNNPVKKIPQIAPLSP